MNRIDDIIDEYGQRIYKYCYGMLRNKQEAEDVMQEVFIKAYRNMDRISDAYTISSWLYKVAYNHCLNIIRRNKLFFFMPIREELQLPEAYNDPAMEDSELSDQLTEVISKLSAADRSVLLLRVIEEKSYEEIAAIFDKQPDAVRKQFERARKKVRGYLEKGEGVKAGEKVSIL